MYRYSCFIIVTGLLFIPLFLIAYEPPIGIPAPEFGIDESHTMYSASLFDFGSGPEAYKDAGNGPYTHYVDKNDPAATDSGNPFGTAAKPRLTIPKNLKAGSVVEVHNGPYTYSESIHGGTYLPIVNASGTAQKPIFIRGADKDNMCEFGGSRQIIVRNVSYVIMENVLINNVSIKIYQPSDHFSLRHSEVTGESSSGITIWTWKNDFTPGHLKEHLVIYNNDIHDNGPYPVNYETGYHAIMIDDATQNVWILDNHIYENGDDGIHILDRMWVSNIGPNADRIFIGRNKMHHDGENAIDVKGSTNVILSQNECYGYATVMPSSSGEAIRINDEGDQDNIWIINNLIYDSEDGINPLQSLFNPHIIGNVIYDCDVAINVDAGVVLNNTIYNTNSAVTGADTVINNIIAKASPTVFSKQPKYASHNLFWQNGEDETCGDCLKTDPLFMNADSGDFRLQTESPAIDNGIANSIYDRYYNLYGVRIDVDFAEEQRPKGDWDIGAYEYEGSGTTKKYLSVNVFGKGTVSISPDSASYSPGTVVTLTATPDPGETFIEWSGDLSGTTNPVQITMDDDKTVNGFFSTPLSDEFIVTPVESQTGQFEASWTAHATADLVDGIIGFSQGVPAAYDDLSIKLMFSNTGFLKAANGDSYTADQEVPYTALQPFAYRMVADVKTHFFSVWITPEGGEEILLANQYAFNLGPGFISSINYLSVKMSYDSQWGGAEGMVEISDFSVTPGVGIQSDEIKLPLQYALNAFPNPFNPVINIEYTLPKSERVELTIFDIKGRKVADLFNGFHEAGSHTLTWDAGNYDIQSSGVYFLNMQSKTFKKTVKMMLLK